MQPVGFDQEGVFRAIPGGRFVRSARRPPRCRHMDGDGHGGVVARQATARRATVPASNPRQPTVDRVTLHAHTRASTSPRRPGPRFSGRCRNNIVVLAMAASYRRFGTTAPARYRPRSDSLCAAVDIVPAAVFSPRKRSPWSCQTSSVISQAIAPRSLFLVNFRFKPPVFSLPAHGRMSSMMPERCHAGSKAIG